MSKKFVSGVVKLTYAAIYTLLLGFGLRIGSDFYLVVDHRARNELINIASRYVDVASIPGVFLADNDPGYMSVLNNGDPVSGSWTISNPHPFRGNHIKYGCYRPRELAWYRHPLPWWTQFIIVPIFSILSSCANQQPLFTRDMVVMCIIACIAYTVNTVVGLYIPYSSIVAIISAFVVGVIGNTYSRIMGDTAFTIMVTAVLFLLPVSFYLVVSLFFRVTYMTS